LLGQLAAADQAASGRDLRRIRGGEHDRVAARSLETRDHDGRLGVRAVGGEQLAQVVRRKQGHVARAHEDGIRGLRQRRHAGRHGTHLAVFVAQVRPAR
jgi:hypothetical protein